MTNESVIRSAEPWGKRDHVEFEDGIADGTVNRHENKNTINVKLAREMVAWAELVKLFSLQAVA